MPPYAQDECCLPTGEDGADRSLAVYRNQFGFIPNHVRRLAELPRLIQAELRFASVFLFSERALTRRRKELILLAMAAAFEDTYAAALHFRALCSLGADSEQLRRMVFDYKEAGLDETEVALLDFAMRLGRHPTWVTASDIEGLRAHGLGDEQILEAVLATSWGGYLRTLSAGLGVEPDFPPPEIPPLRARRTVFAPPTPRTPGERGGPFVGGADLASNSFPPFVRVREKWGFVPNLFRAQSFRPELVEAELDALNLWLNSSDVLSARQKEYVFLAISAANLNTYCVAAHCAILRSLGVSPEDSDQIALDYRRANIAEGEKALVGVCLKVAREPAGFCAADTGTLREHGFSERQILEAVAIAAISNLVNTLNIGLGIPPDFEPRIELNTSALHLFSPAADHKGEMTPGALATHFDEETDAACVMRVQAGDAGAFEELVRRHGRRVFRTLAGILRQDADIEDAVQDTFVRAYQSIGQFEGRSAFSTWLTRIAINAGLQRLRGRREFESLDDGTGVIEDLRPRHLQAWQENPEQRYSKAEMRELVLNAVSQLPLKYRIVVTLRDLQQFSTKETAVALDLKIPAVKARLFRARLMLREALSPYFTEKNGKRTHG